MTSKIIDNVFASFGELDSKCNFQVEFQKKHLNRLITRMESYDWALLADEGVKLKDRDIEPKSGDVPVFLNQISAPITITVFAPENKVFSRSLPSLLEMALEQAGMFTGPIGRKIPISTGDTTTEVTNAISLFYDKDTTTLRLVC